MSHTAPALHPPAGLPGLDPSWSRLVEARDSLGVVRTWHLLDTRQQGSGPATLTLLCVHGNPTWSYLWRRLCAAAPTDVRVLAVDQLDMGFSERTGVPRSLAMRVEDLDGLTSSLGLDGPVVTVAHDWGGPISLGWALRNKDRLRGVVLLNTAVHQPADSLAPGLIRLARSRPMLRNTTVRTPVFVRGTTLLSGRSLPPEIARAYAAPYTAPDRREAIAEFVADIPLEPSHRSRMPLDEIARGVTELDVPALLMWGPGDPVFGDRYLNDLIARMPHADVHRYEGARHLVSEDAPALVTDLLTWVGERIEPPTRPLAQLGEDADRRPLWSALDTCADTRPDDVALAEPVRGGWRRVTWGRMAANVDRLARGLHARAVRPGDRVAVLVTPGADLLATVYACWRLGASVVVTDAGLGARGIVRALRSAAPHHVVAIPKAEVLVRASRLPVSCIPVADLAAIATLGEAQPPLAHAPLADDEAAVAFTSGATGPAKGVVYTHRQVERTRNLLQSHYDLGDADALVAAFAPWAVLGPALGIPSVLPRMNLSAPTSLTAAALAEATEQVRGTVLWASPAALTNIVRTSGVLDPAERAALGSLRLVLGAGAPVSPGLLRGMRSLCPDASIRTPYGMTEVLPVTDVELEEIEAVGPGTGVLVGRPLPGVNVRISPVDGKGRATGASTDAPHVLGEILVSAPHRKSRYDRLWATEQASSSETGWHRTGDLGHLDDQGRLWVEGRLAHVITTASGPVGPVGIEQAAERAASVQRAAAVGVGPAGIQQIVVVIEVGGAQSGPAPVELAAAVRAEVDAPVAAVLARRGLPVDVRHRSKVDRAAVAQWAARVLRGRERT